MPVLPVCLWFGEMLCCLCCLCHLSCGMYVRFCRGRVPGQAAAGGHDGASRACDHAAGGCTALGEGAGGRAW